MDYQNRIGSKKGSGGVASQQDQLVAQKKRLNQLFDIENDPYFFKNNVGQYECRLCHTLHTSNDSYLNHVNGKKHQLNVLKRSRYEKEKKTRDDTSLGETVTVKNDYEKIGTPTYQVQKIRDEETGAYGLLFQVDVKEFKEDHDPFYRFMSCFEYEKDTEKNSDYQYLLINAKPYEIISFKIPSKEINFDSFWAYYDKDIKQYYIQFLYKEEEEETENNETVRE